jgi:lipoate-protein ligase B
MADTDLRATTPPALAAYLLGTVEFESALALQQRLVFDASGDPTGQTTLILCEHPALVTIGRQGSRGDIDVGNEELAQRRIEVRWVNRGGGAILHSPGQLAIYPVVPIEHLGWNPGQYLTMLQTALQAALAELGVNAHTQPDRAGLWTRNGLMVAIGVAIKSGVSYFGAYINVDVPIASTRRVRSDPVSRQPMTSLSVERRRGVRMPAVRESIVRHLAATFGPDRYHIYSRHPLLVRKTIATPLDDASLDS